MVTHVFDGGRCIYCNVNDDDDALYGPYECKPHQPGVWSFGPEGNSGPGSEDWKYRKQLEQLIEDL